MGDIHVKDITAAQINLLRAKANAYEQMSQQSSFWDTMRDIFCKPKAKPAASDAPKNTPQP